MSTIKVDEILAADGTTTTPPTIPALDTRFCTAWVNFEAIGTITILDSYNVASITDGGVGIYTINFAVSLANANYTWSSNNSDTTGSKPITYSTVTPTVSAYEIRFQLVNNTYFDGERIMTQVFGGQA
tara:strand:- start:15 stop:398 length:384 start_codon:yes stop_codon:yes gene_type:complete